MNKEILRMESINKTFGSHKPLKEAWLNVWEGEIVGLLGLNNSGKTLMMEILTGRIPMESGRIYYDDQLVEITSAEQVKALGIHYIYTEDALINSFSIAENIFVACKRQRGLFLDNKANIAKTNRLLQMIGLDVPATTAISKLSKMEQLMIQVIKAVSQNAKVIIIDNICPSFGLNTLEILKSKLQIVAQEGVSFIISDYRAASLMLICDRIFVLRRGMIAGSFESDRFVEEQLTAIMVGYEVETEPHVPILSSDTRVLLEFQNVYNSSLIKDLSFSIKSNEVVGLCSMSEGFKQEFLQILTGSTPKSGQIMSENKTLRLQKPSHMLKAGIGLLTPNNTTFQNLQLNNNIILTANQLFSYSLGIVREGYLRYLYNEMYSNYFYNKISLRKHSYCNNVDSITSKIIGLCRNLAADCKLLVSVNPTSDLDIISSEKLLSLFSNLTNNGRAILMLSSDIQELMNICNRIYFVHDGRAILEMNVTPNNQSNIMESYHFFCTLS